MLNLSHILCSLSDLMFSIKSLKSEILKADLEYWEVLENNNQREIILSNFMLGGYKEYISFGVKCTERLLSGSSAFECHSIFEPLLNY